MTRIESRSLSIAARFTCFALLSSCAFAQSGAVVEGKVVSSSDGTPVRRATVLLRAAKVLGDLAAVPDRENYAADTDGSGRFRFEGIAPGVYECLPSRPGFEAGPPDRSPRTPHIAVAEGQHLENLVLRLTPVGVISGRVLDPEGQPVPDAEVVAMQYAYSDRGKALVMRRQVYSDDRGEFRLFGLYPGGYYLRATPLAEGAVSRYSSFGPAGVNRNRFAFGPPRNAVRGPEPPPLMTTYYPSAGGVLQARAIDLPAGGEARDSDIRLQSRGLYSVRGTAPAGGGTRVVVPENRSDPDLRVPATRVEADGSFEMRSLPSGSYVLHLIVPNQPGSAPRVSRTLVDIRDHDVEGVQLQEASPVQVSGVVKSAGKTAVALQSLVIKVQSMDAGGMRADVQPKADGRFTMNDFASDVYRVALGGSTGAYGVSLKLGDKELADGVLDLQNQTAAALTLTISADFGSVDGKVTGDDGLPLPAASVTLIPERADWDWQSRYQAMETDSEGRFAFQKAPPGIYKVFAWRDVPTGAPRDAEFRAPFEKLGLPINVEVDKRQTLELKAIDTDRRQ